jgi:hypothetical protein
MIDPAWAKVVVDVAQFAILGAIGVHQWSVGRDRVRQAQVSHLQTDLDEITADHKIRLTKIEAAIEHMPAVRTCALQHERLSRIEEQVKHMPGPGDLRAIYDRLNPIGESVAGLSAQVSGLNQNLADIKHGLAVLNESLLRREEGRRP